MGRRRRLHGFALVLSAVALWTPQPASAHVVGNLTDDEHHDWRRLETHARRVQSVCSLPDENGGESIDDVACTLALLDAGFADLHPHSTIGRKLLEEREGGFRVPIPIFTKEGFRASKLSIWLPSLADLLPSSHSDPYEFFYFVKRILTWIDNIFVKFSIADAKCDFYAPTYRPELKLLVAPEIKCTRPRLTTSVCLAVKPPIADLLPFELHLPLCIPIRLIVEAVNILANLDVVIDGILEAAMDRVDASAMPAARAYVACGGSVDKIATFVSDVGSALGATATATERGDQGTPLPVLNAMSALLLDPGLQQSASSALRLPCLLKDENAREAALAAAGQLAGKEVVPLLKATMAWLHEYLDECPSSDVAATMQMAGTIVKATALSLDDPLLTLRNAKARESLNAIPWPCVFGLPATKGLIFALVELTTDVSEGLTQFIYDFLVDYFADCYGSVNDLLLIYDSVMDFRTDYQNFNVVDLMFRMDARTAGCMTSTRLQDLVNRILFR